MKNKASARGWGLFYWDAGNREYNGVLLVGLNPVLKGTGFFNKQHVLTGEIQYMACILKSLLYEKD